MQFRTTRAIRIGDTVAIAGHVPDTLSSGRYRVLCEAQVDLPPGPGHGHMFELQMLDGPHVGLRRNCWDYYLVLVASNPPELPTQPLPNL